MNNSGKNGIKKFTGFLKLVVGVSILMIFFIPITVETAGYVNPPDYFQIPEGSAAPTLNGVRDTTPGTYTTGATESGTYIQIWAYNYSNYIYMYIELLLDTDVDDADSIALCFEKNHDNALDTDDEAIQKFPGSDVDYEWSGSNWVTTSGSTFDFEIAVAGTLQNGHRAYEFKLSESDCGWSDTDTEFGFYVEGLDFTGSVTETAGCWPDETTGHWKDIDYYGEVAEEYLPEFPIQSVLLLAIPMIITIGTIKYKRKH